MTTSKPHTVTIPVFETLEEVASYIIHLENVAAAAKFYKNRIVDDIQDSMPGQWVCVPHNDFKALRKSLEKLYMFIKKRSKK